MAKLDKILNEIFEYNKKTGSLEKGFFMESSNRSNQIETYIRPPFLELRKLFGKSDNCFSTSIGCHPDFINLKENSLEYQYIVSVFMDISGSTKLGLKFDLPQVRFYKNAILRSAIEIFQAFDGHIHRLQGDAIFAFFGSKSVTKADAIINALNASSLMQSFNKNSLNDFFDSYGLDPLKIRIGIDVGDDPDVLWSKYGIADIHEITTTSIHTDLAAKLQSKAKGNSIMIGENIFRYLDLPDKYLTIRNYQENSQQVEELFIIKNPNYSMRLFEWGKYLEDFPYSINDRNSNYISPDHFELKCYIIENDIETEYHSSSFALKKNLKLKFVFLAKFLKPTNIKWEVENTGQEARLAGNLKFSMPDKEGKYECFQTTQYNGYHYMICSIFGRNNSLIIKCKFGIFVNDNIQSLKSISYKVVIE
ncbi:nucleotide-binding domain-containing protein [Paenibacillus sp. WLX2291]|uniref:nucleotide-binding domain-containing protein n=1 Tax=Paenibacillus sp. WLX2291 TaxID=3296934 RepID=UPI0039842B1C